MTSTTYWPEDFIPELKLCQSLQLLEQHMHNTDILYNAKLLLFSVNNKTSEKKKGNLSEGIYIYISFDVRIQRANPVMKQR